VVRTLHVLICMGVLFIAHHDEMPSKEAVLVLAERKHEAHIYITKQYMTRVRWWTGCISV
jgi:hypothetical protein